MKNIIKILTATLSSFAVVSSLSASLLISQYVETNSGTTPKAIELWNPGSSTVDFALESLTVSIGYNGSSTPTTQVTVSSGSLSAGDVMVIGTTDVGTYLSDTFGTDAPTYVSEAFNFNGDDSLVIALGGVTVDVFGTVGIDPGSRWSGGGIATYNSSIQLKENIVTASSGWSDPSIRFESSTDISPNATGGLAGFGVAPVPETSTYSLIAGLLGLTYVMLKRRQA